MKHLDDNAVLAAAQAGEETTEAGHQTACVACRRRVEWMRGLLENLAAARELSAGLPPGLLRWARAYARTIVRPSERWSLLGLLSEGAPAAAAVRGGVATGAAFLYGDGRHQLDLRVEPGAGGAIRLHGQVIPLEGPYDRAWRIVAISPAGDVTHATSDQAGEFRLDGVGSWVGLSLVAEHGEDRLVIGHLGTRAGPDHDHR